MKQLSVLPSPVRAMGGSPVGTRNRSKTDTSLTQLVGKPTRLLNQRVSLERICRPGKVSEDAADPAVGTEGVRLDAVPETPKTTHNINNNYCVVDPVAATRSLNVVPSVKDKKHCCSCSTKCILFCCQSCTFCNKKGKAAAKERLKSSIKIQKRNKFCEMCFYCRSLCFCPNCSQCPQCCTCSASGRVSAEFLADLGPPRHEFKGSFNLEGRLCASVQNQTSSSKRSLDSQQLCKPPLEPLPEGGFAGSASQEGSRDGKGSNISSLLQQTFNSAKTEPKVASYFGPRCFEQIFGRKNIQNGDPGNKPYLSSERGMGDIAGLQRRLFPYPNT